MPHSAKRPMPDMPPIHVAVIDSGIHADHPHIGADRLLPGVTIDAEGMATPGAPDRLGHGTAVAAAILEKAPHARLIPLRLFHHHLHANALALACAIDWCVARGDVDIVNLSLGLPAIHPPPLLAHAVDRALAAGVVVIAAHDHDAGPCWPGAMPGVLGVGLDWDCPRETWRLRHDGILTASGYPRPIPGIPLRRNLHGVSFAVAQMSGFACHALPDLPRGRTRPAALAAWLRERAQAASYEAPCPSVQT